MVDRTTTYANATPSAATRARVARPVRTSTAAVPAPAPAPRVLAVSVACRGAVGFVQPQPSHGALPAQYIGVRELRLGSRNLFLYKPCTFNLKNLRYIFWGIIYEYVFKI
jgi:hypothetical protein